MLALFCTSSANAQQQPAPPSPIVRVHIQPIPLQLKSKLKGRLVLSCGTAPFGDGASQLWVICLAKRQNEKSDFLEFWQPTSGKSFLCLRRLRLPSALKTSSSTRSLETDQLGCGYGIELRWLFPAQHRGPVVVAPSGEYYDPKTLYTFDKGWHDPKPIVQVIEAFDRGKFESPVAYTFNSTNAEGVLRGSAFVPYQMTAPEDYPGDVHKVQWKSGVGWIHDKDVTYSQY